MLNLLKVIILGFKEQLEVLRILKNRVVLEGDNDRELMGIKYGDLVDEGLKSSSSQLDKFQIELGRSTLFRNRRNNEVLEFIGENVVEPEEIAVTTSNLERTITIVFICGFSRNGVNDVGFETFAALLGVGHSDHKLWLEND